MAMTGREIWLILAVIVATTLTVGALTSRTIVYEEPPIPVSVRDMPPALAQQPDMGREPIEVPVEVVRWTTIAAIGEVLQNANLRIEPQGTVLTTVPAGAEIQMHECTNWCLVSYQGQRGYIYADFVRFRSER